MGRIIIGVDEAGRGAWAGPLVVAAVGLAEPIAGLNDSKLLSPRRRKKLALLIKRRARFIGYGQVDAGGIDKLGLSSALRLAMNRAVAGAPNGQIIVDGPINYVDSRPHSSALIKADTLVPCVMAASILAKVKRDEIMQRAAELWPAYGFERHVGYGTATHAKALEKHGTCELHRQSFKPIAALGNL